MVSALFRATWLSRYVLHAQEEPEFLAACAPKLLLKGRLGPTDTSVKAALGRNAGCDFRATVAQGVERAAVLICDVLFGVAGFGRR